MLWERVVIYTDHFPFFHHAVHHIDVTVDDAGVLGSGAGIFFRSFVYFDALNKQAEQFRHRFINGGVPFGLFDECFHIMGRIDPVECASE